MRKPKPKFRVGQVVCRTNGSLPKHLVVTKVSKLGYYCALSDGSYYLTSHLRPLTTREIGPRPKRGKR